MEIMENAAIILTTTPIPNDVKLIISLGPKFILPQKQQDINIMDHTNTILKIHQLEHEAEARKIGHKMKLETQKNNTLNHTDRKLIKMSNDTINFFKHHKNLMIVESDKNKATIIMEKSDYNRKIQEKLEQNIELGIISKTTKKHEEIIAEIERAAEIMIAPMLSYAPTEYKCKISQTLNTKQHRISTIYANVKTHKADNPIRIITNTIDSPGRALAEFIKDILTTLFPPNRSTHKVPSTLSTG